MTTTFIDTNVLPRVKTPQGQMTEVLNEHLAGAKNVNGALRWLDGGEAFDATASNKHQLLYLMEGAARISLDGKDYDVTKGCGVYLEPSETATIKAVGEPVKLFHLVVPVVPA
ncbi:MAG TPA: AraC family ligand binding domain-containing protein [Caulobacteraceae bacterium]|jgi:hypothetical protein|nr:AraC family ligand binding domain-containing protein [Caulobacteraceae bacterium]